MLPGLDLVALVNVDVEFLHLFLAYPQYADITPVDEHYVCRQGYQLDEPGRHQLRVEKVAPHSANQCHVEAVEVSSK